MIPIGRASIAGKLTFKSTTTISAKEGISMGAGAQKITTDVTGNSKISEKAAMFDYNSLLFFLFYGAREYRNRMNFII